MVFPILATRKNQIRFG